MPYIPEGCDQQCRQATGRHIPMPRVTRCCLRLGPLVNYLAWAIIAVVCALVVTATPARAEGWTIGVHALSFHTSPGYETVTPGLYARSPSGWTFGAYRNSEAGRSAYAGYTWERGPWALTAGGVTGYRRAPVVPMVLPSYRFGNGLRAVFVLNPAGGSAAHLAWEFR